MKAKIDKGIPIPPMSPRSNLGKLLHALQPGDSFVTKMHRASVYSLARHYGISVAIRSEGDGQMRVWRTNKNQTKLSETNI